MAWSQPSAAQPVAGIELRWEAPPGCPRADEVRARIRRLLGPGAASVTSKEPLAAEGTVVATNGRYRLALRVRQEKQPSGVHADLRVGLVREPRRSGRGHAGAPRARRYDRRGRGGGGRRYDGPVPSAHLVDQPAHVASHRSRIGVHFPRGGSLRGFRSLDLRGVPCGPRLAAATERGEPRPRAEASGQ